MVDKKNENNERLLVQKQKNKKQLEIIIYLKWNVDILHFYEK
jgi:hypothetical protein